MIQNAWGISEGSKQRLSLFYFKRKLHRYIGGSKFKQTDRPADRRIPRQRVQQQQRQKRRQQRQ